MKIKSITIQGFRGFNEERTIHLHDRLTLYYAPNSYGKTSVSEALEWLLYGITSKVKRADSKDEYKGSYRNLHLEASKPAFVNVTFIDDGNQVNYTGALTGGDGIVRLLNGNEISSWPLKVDLLNAPQPFILQHALKYLLLAKPGDRFKGFAVILGLEELEEFQNNVQSVCTKPQVCLPQEAVNLLSKVDSIKTRLANQPALQEINKAFKKGASGLKKTYEAVDRECQRRVPAGTAPDSILPQLLKIREDAVAKIFKGSIELPEYTQPEKDSKSSDERYIINFVDGTLIKKCTNLTALSAALEILDRIKFFGLGIALLNQEPGKCPFCSQAIDSSVDKHIRDQHESLKEEQVGKEKLERERTETKSSLSSLKSRLDSYHNNQVRRSSKLNQLEPKLEDLKKILLPKYQTHFNSVRDAISEIKTKKGQLAEPYAEAAKAVDGAINSIDTSNLDVELLKSLGLKLVKYIKLALEYTQSISQHANPLAEADKVLQHGWMNLPELRISVY